MSERHEIAPLRVLDGGEPDAASRQQEKREEKQRAYHAGILDAINGFRRATNPPQAHRHQHRRKSTNVKKLTGVALATAADEPGRLR